MRQVLVLLVLGTALAAAGPALAGGRFGLKIGTGTSFYQDEDPKFPGDAPNVLPFAIGAAYVYDLVLLAIEVDALYWRNSFESGDATDDSLVVPVIAKVSLPVIPLLLGIDLGVGLEPRFHLSSDPEPATDPNAMVLYLPVVVGANLDLKVIGVGLEMRYEHQLTEAVDGEDDRLHQLMFFGGVLF